MKSAANSSATCTTAFSRDCLAYCSSSAGPSWAPTLAPRRRSPAALRTSRQPSPSAHDRRGAYPTVIEQAGLEASLHSVVELGSWPVSIDVTHHPVPAVVGWTLHAIVDDRQRSYDAAGAVTANLEGDWLHVTVDAPARDLPDMIADRIAALGGSSLATVEMWEVSLPWGRDPRQGPPPHPVGLEQIVVELGHTVIGGVGSAEELLALVSAGGSATSPMSPSSTSACRPRTPTKVWPAWPRWGSLGRSCRCSYCRTTSIHRSRCSSSAEKWGGAGIC